MTLFELTALDAAYKALQPLDVAGRRRALQWLSNALGQAQTVPQLKTPSDNGTANGTAPPVEAGPQRDERPAATAAPRSRTRGRKTPAGKKVTAEATRRHQQTATTSTKRSGARPYRRMPDPDEVMAAYQQVGTVSGLADHFGVPRYTVQNWAARLRTMGYDIGRGS